MAVPKGILSTATYSGRRVIIYTFDAGGKSPIHGAYEAGDGEWIMCAWGTDGKLNPNKSSSLDIVINSFILL